MATYRVALRGWERGESYCSCPDFRKNTLGTCKHILHVLEKVPRSFSQISQGAGVRADESGDSPELWRRAGTQNVRAR